MAGGESAIGRALAPLFALSLRASQALAKGEASVSVEKAPGRKCARCWKVLEEVKEDTSLCNRCTDAVESLKKSEAA